MIFKKFWKKAIIGSSIFTSVLATGLSTGLLSHSNKSESQRVSNNSIDYHQEINKNTEQLKQTIQKTPRNDLLKMLDSFSNHNADKPSLKFTTATVQTKYEKHNEQYAIKNLSIIEKNKIADLVFQIGSGKILIKDLVKKAEENSHNDLNHLISKTITVNDSNNKQNLELKNTKSYLLNNKSSEVSTNYSNEELKALAAFIDPNYLNHLRERSNYLISYATILGVATAAAWGIAAYYWTCWWMFGGNIPFAIAATVQAGLMTADMRIAWADYTFNEITIQNILNLHNKPIYNYFKYSMNDSITLAKLANWLYTNKISYGSMNFIKNWLSEIKNIIKSFLKKAFQTTVAKTGIKSGIAATSWASPVGLTVISLILKITNLIIKFIWN